jgi:Na+/H+ antiporter NhaD/arsenite permease-like protein
MFLFFCSNLLEEFPFFSVSFFFYSSESRCHMVYRETESYWLAQWAGRNLAGKQLYAGWVLNDVPGWVLYDMSEW